MVTFEGLGLQERLVKATQALAQEAQLANPDFKPELAKQQRLDYPCFSLSTASSVFLRPLSFVLPVNCACRS